MNKVKEVSWRKGFRAKVDAKKAFDELERIKELNDGILTAGLVVDAAKSKKNPLHAQFEWDDTKAAEEYRLNQGRNLLAAVNVVYEEAAHVPPQRGYSVTIIPSVDDKPARTAYKSTDEILQDPIARGELLGNAIREALAYRKKYNGLSELSKIFKAMDDFVSSEVSV